MGKATIIEAQNSNTVYEEGKSKGTLGKLKGIFADYKNGTRNSDRLYTEELWDNRVFGSEDVMEALQTKTLFGELDHPEGDRCETLAKNAAITITKLEKRPDEGVIYGEAEILDTPTGRIVKALADSGAQLGISSRGMGEEIYQEGKNIIDPETYDFITFDVVVTPANTKARVSLTESKHLNKLTESLQKEIKESETTNQLNQIKTVLENVNMKNKENLIKQIETKITSINTPVNTKLTEANKSIALELLRKQYTEQKEVLDNTLEMSETIVKENKSLVEKNNNLKIENNKLNTENTKLQEEKEFLTDSRNTLKGKLKEAKVSIDTLKQNIEEVKTNNEKAINQNTIVLQKQLQNALEKTKKLENENKTLKETNTKLQEEKKLANKKLNNLHTINENLTKNIDTNSKILIEMKNTNKQLQNKVNELETKTTTTNTLNQKLTENKKLQEQQTKQLQNKVNELEEELKRFSKLSFNPINADSIITENYKQTQYTDEELQLLDALIKK